MTIPLLFYCIKKLHSVKIMTYSVLIDSLWSINNLQSLERILRIQWSMFVHFCSTYITAKEFLHKFYFLAILLPVKVKDTQRSNKD